MRHPTTGLNEDDLSRLTDSSSSTASSDSSSSSSSSPSSSGANTPSHKEGPDENAHHQHQNQNQQQKQQKQQQQKSKCGSPEKISLKSNNDKNTSHHNTSSRFSSTYLPELIYPIEWQRSRKRKERLDSSSSATQDRKLQRSNSEELLPQEVVSSEADVNAGSNALRATKAADVIRRVSSEDFKRTASYGAYEQELKEADGKSTDEQSKQQQQQQQQQQQPSSKAVDENDASLANRQQNNVQQQPQQQQQQQQQQETPVYRDSWMTGPTRDMTRRSRYETSPARSQRFSPIRGNNGSNGKYRDGDDSECEHERRRSSERFCKTRLPPGRKSSGLAKKRESSGSGSKYLSSKRNDENAYKYDLTSWKYERRGFVSKKVPAASEKATNDHNDNNLIDFHQQQQQSATPKAGSGSGSGSGSSTVSPTTPTSGSGSGSGADKSTAPITPTGSAAADTSPTSSKPVAVPAHHPKLALNIPPPLTQQEALPWDRAVPEDQAPVLSRRYAAVRHHPVDNLDTAAKFAKVMPYPQQYHKQASAAHFYADAMDCMEPLDTFRAFTSFENVRTRDVMEQIIPAMMSFQTPEERLKQVNKRLTALKKKLSQLEEAYEARVGYRPSQAERLNDKYMKNILAELNKLRKERQELKADPMPPVGMKVCGDMDATKKLEKMKDTLLEIEQSLTDKREDANRSDVLDELTADQLVQEKSAVQHGLLYFESLYGRPSTKDERDAARPLYDRYRLLKRMVARSVTLSGTAASGAPELPTILENEAMVFEFTPQPYSSNNSTDTTNSPSDSMVPTASSDDSTTTTTTTVPETTSGGIVTSSTSAATATATATAAAVVAAASAIFPIQGSSQFQHQHSTPQSSAVGDDNVRDLSIEQLWEQLEKTREEKKLLKRTIREYETIFEEQNGRKMLKSDRKTIEETYAQYKEKKAKTRLLQELIKKQRRSFP